MALYGTVLGSLGGLALQLEGSSGDSTWRAVALPLVPIGGGLLFGGSALALSWGRTTPALATSINSGAFWGVLAGAYSAGLAGGGEFDTPGARAALIVGPVLGPLFSVMYYGSAAPTSGEVAVRNSTMLWGVVIETTFMSALDPGLERERVFHGVNLGLMAAGAVVSSRPDVAGSSRLD